MTEHRRPDQALADELELAGAGMADLELAQLSAAGRLVRLAGRLVDAVGLAHIAESRGLDVVLAELVDDIAAQHDDDELELEPGAEIIELVHDRSEVRD